MYSRQKLFTPIVVALMALAVVLAGMLLYASPTLFYFGLALLLIVFAVALVLLRQLNRRTRSLLEEMAEGIKLAMGDDYSELPNAVLTVYGQEIIWYNDICGERVFDGRDMHGADVSEILPGMDLSVTSPPEGYNIVYGNHSYTVYVVAKTTENARSSVVYLIDDTRLKYYANEYHESKPGIALFMVDNYEELVQDYKDSERAQLMGEIELAIENYVAVNHGFVTKIAKDRFIAVIETRGIRTMLADKFDLLDRVRAMGEGERMSATLSIGLAEDAANLYEAEANARQALDMCLGRGGDQAAVRTPNGYEFYGGMSKAIEKRTKVKTRIIANALSELIESSSNVILMGHRFADLDCLGSAVGMLKAVRSMGKPAAIAIDRTRNLVEPLIEKLVSSGYDQDDFLDPDIALELVGPQTLLIIVDTHVPGVTESEAIYRAARSVVVIDHHRKLVGHIDNAVIFYHEPYASSASEMVTELVQYFPSRPALSRIDAEALMAGIMLDTKNFVMRTGVRTFEAAAWLRRLGADTIEVRKLFASSMEAYQQKAAFISGAEIYHNCAIAASDYTFEGIKITAPQAADELMTISGVDASFVIFLYGDQINVSARSMGTVNVQLIMEKLGGGGHHTMAAAQFNDIDMETVRRRVMEAIDEYYTETNHKT